MRSLNVNPKDRRLFQVKVGSLNVNPKHRRLFQVKVGVYESLRSSNWEVSPFRGSANADYQMAGADRLPRAQ